MGLTLNLDILTPEQWNGQLTELLNKLHEKNIKLYSDEAKKSTARVMYPLLNYALGTPSYFQISNSIDYISTIFKIRGELMPLNYIPHRENPRNTCGLCTLEQCETVIHFIGICPALQELRLQYFGELLLTTDEACNILDGRDWQNLYKFCKEALKYRN